jgi:ligand-binding sensor domain-containing protein
MQRTAFILACFFFCTNCFAQQYPFVHYTPKDGLISNQIKSIYQDSKGRLYFPSMNGLSIYDGSRFINYTQENGLRLNIVNHVMEMGDDSIWIITNSDKINYLVNGELKTLDLKGTGIILNHLVRNEKGDLYAASEQGLYIFEKDHFTQLPLTDAYGKDINPYIAYLIPIGDHLLIQRDHGLLDDLNRPLYLYDTKARRVTAEIPQVSIASRAPDGRIWISAEKNIMSLDTAELKNDRIVLQELPAKYALLRSLGKYFIYFDRANNCWLGNQSDVLIKAGHEGTITYFPKSSGLSMHFINHIFQDREGITWIATNNGGVNKLVHSNFSFLEKPFNISPPFGDVFYNEQNDQVLFYAKQNAMAVLVKNDKQVTYNANNATEIHGLTETPYGIFGRSTNQLYKMIPKGNTLYPEALHPPSTDNLYGNAMLDKNDNLIVCGTNYITAIVNGQIISRKKLNYYADRTVTDTQGNIWVVTRLTDLTMYRPRPDNPSDYLEEKLYFKKELSGIAARTMIIDKNNNIWIGSRSNGVHVFRVENGNLVKKFNFTKSSGLSDDFISYLEFDRENNIWACSPSGLDKITLKNGFPVIENLTKQNNIYQSVFKVVIDKNNTVWATVSNGLIRITPEKERSIDYSPALMVSLMKTGKDTIAGLNAVSLSHKQNNLTFYFGATSFIDEKQILYSYRLIGGSNNQWSEPSNNATVSFIDLPPGDYRLNIKAKFPPER